MLCRLSIILLSLICLSIGSEEMDQSIIIIGSGLSGLSAARKLLENGFNDIIILEAENRIGGRVYSVDFSDGIIDLGAQWVHGQKNNIIYEMMNKHFDFGSTPFEEIYSTYLLSNGTIPNQRDFRKLSEVGFKIFDGLDEVENPRGSIGELFLQKFDKALKNPKLSGIDSKVIDLMKEDMERMMNSYCATTSWFDLSAKLNAAEEKAEGNQYLTWKKQGFKTLFDFITKKAPNQSENLNIESKVQLNKKVMNIKYNTKDASAKATISCADGTTYTAKHVIFTPSLGVLKKYHESLFTPKLPANKILAINNYGFGVVGKVFLEFDETFWIEKGKQFISYDLLWLDTDKIEAKSSNREWLMDVTGIFAVDQFPNLLEFFLAGKNMREFEMVSDQKLIDDCMWMMEKFLGKSLPKPKAMKRTVWLTNENFLGTYSYGSIDAEKANVGVREIAETIKNTDGTPIILFAGEATDQKYPSMAHGAVRSGFRVANEIIKFYD